MRTMISILGLAVVASLFATSGAADPVISTIVFEGNLTCGARVLASANCPGSRVGQTSSVSTTDIRGVLLELVPGEAQLNADGTLGVTVNWNKNGVRGGASADGTGTVRLYLEKGADNKTFCLEGCANPAAPLPELPNGDGAFTYAAFVTNGNVVVEQPFTVYVSVFDGEPMPDGFTAVPE